MIEKVKELVEWVAWKSYDKVAGGVTLRQYQRLRNSLKESHVTFAKRILSHPDLVLIDWDGYVARGYMGTNIYPVIPLVDALKEAKE